MDTITAEIDVKSNVGKKIVNISNSYPKHITINNPLPENFENAIPIENAINRGYDRLTDHYGVDMRILTKKHLNEI